MKYKVIIEGDEDGWTETVIIDGEQKHFIEMKDTGYGAKQVSKNETRINEDDEQLADIVDSFNGYDLMRYAQDVG